MDRLSTKQILAAADDWRAWGKRFGWELIGLGDYFANETQSASFHRNQKPRVVGGMEYADQFNITRAMRDDIDAALRSELTK